MSTLFAAGGSASHSTPLVLPGSDGGVPDPLADPLADPVTTFPELPLNLDEMQVEDNERDEMEGTLSVPPSPPILMAGRFPAPPHWVCMLDTPPVPRYQYYMQVPLAPGFERYDDIHASLRKACPSFLPMSFLENLEISQIQHPVRYEKFCNEAEMLEIPLNSPMIERCFHGCSGWSVNSIMRDGFNKSFLGLNGSNFGKGIYFGRDLKWAIKPRYASPNMHGVRHIFVCDVIAGNSRVGHLGLKILGNDPENHAMYHSACDNREKPSIRVMFNEEWVVVTDLVKFTLKPLEDFLVSLFFQGAFGVRKALIDKYMGYYEENPGLWNQEEMEPIMGRYPKDRMRECAFLQNVTDDNLQVGKKVDACMAMLVVRLIYTVGLELFISLLPSYIAKELNLKIGEGNREIDTYNVEQIHKYWKHWTFCFIGCRTPEVKCFQVLVLDPAEKDERYQAVRGDKDEMTLFKEFTGNQGLCTCMCRFCKDLREKEKEEALGGSAGGLAGGLASGSASGSAGGSAGKSSALGTSGGQPVLPTSGKRARGPSSTKPPKPPKQPKANPLSGSYWLPPKEDRKPVLPSHLMATPAENVGPNLDHKSISPMGVPVPFSSTLVAGKIGTYKNPGGFLYLQEYDMVYCNFGRGLLEYSKNGGRNSMVHIPAFIPCLFDAERSRVDPKVGYSFVQKGPLGTGYYLQGVLEHFKANEGKNCAEEVVDASTGISHPVDLPTMRFWTPRARMDLVGAQLSQQSQQSQQPASGGVSQGGQAAAGAPVVAQGTAGVALSGPSIPAPQPAGALGGSVGGPAGGGPAGVGPAGGPAAPTPLELAAQHAQHIRAASRCRKPPSPTVVSVPVSPPVSAPSGGVPPPPPDVLAASGGSGPSGEGQAAQP